MAGLINQKTNEVLAHNVITARRFLSRAKGLMGKKDFPISCAFWIVPCKGGIHTFFMKFPIDVIFVNRSLHIIRVFKNIRPWKLVYPPFFSKSYSVFEFKTPALKPYHLTQGDKLYVDH